MNKTQKGAWFSLAIFSASIVATAYQFYGLAVTKDLPNQLWVMVIFAAAIGLWFLIIGIKKTDPDNIIFEERDLLIKKKSISIAFITTWLLLGGFSLISYFIIGQQGAIKGWLIPFIVLEMFFIVMIVYALSILTQYGWRNKNE
jgi:hypothetical protein